MRAELPVLRARGLRLRLAETLQARDPLTPDDALRIARLLLDGGASIPPDLLLDAAQAANLAGDPDLGARLAQLATAGGAGLRATLLLARAHTVRQRPEDAEAVLAAAEERARVDPLAVEYLGQRLFGLFWGLHRSEEARRLLARAQGWACEPLRNQQPWVARAEGWAARARSDVAGAEVLRREATNIDVAIHSAPLTYEALRAGAPPTTAAARLEDLTRHCDATFTAYAEHAAACAKRDAHGLLGAAEAMAAIGALRYGMEAAVQAAETFLAEGRQDSARRAVARARELHVPGRALSFLRSTVWTRRRRG